MSPSTLHTPSQLHCELSDVVCRILMSQTQHCKLAAIFAALAERARTADADSWVGEVAAKSVHVTAYSMDFSVSI